MRSSNNPSKEQILLKKNTLHRVIIPLFIPYEDSYYKDAWKIFNFCLNSLIKTSKTQLVVSVISNGCCESVNNRLYALFEKNLIDELIMEREPIGKINSILKVLRSVEEPLITITDADVLFLNGWEEAILNVFNSFPKAAAVCPTPVFRKHNNYTYNIWFDYLFSKKLKFTEVPNPEAMTKFANSIGWPWLDNKYKDVFLTLEANNGLKAMVGCSHFAATYKKEIFNDLPKNNSMYQLGGDSEGVYLDIPGLKYDGYRLSTVENYAYHMGNAYEDWFLEEFDKLVNIPKNEIKTTYTKLRKNKLKYYIKSKLFKKLIGFKLFKIWFYKSKGLSNEQVSNFLH